MSENLNELPQDIPAAIHLTDSAANKIFELLQEENNNQLCLRIYVTGGGCSGMQYGFSFDEKIDPNDALVEKAINSTTAIRVLIDPVSFQYLAGARIDFEDKFGHSQFIIKNPNAKTSCGCGSSFSTDD